MLIEPDYSEAAVTLPDGTYKVRITNVEQRTAQTGTPMLNWKLEVTGNNNPALNGRVLFHSTPITGPGASFLKRFVKAVIGEEVAKFDTTDLLGRELAIVTKTKADREFPDVIKVLSASAAAVAA
jgi:hypothetical protein